MDSGREESNWVISPVSLLATMLLTTLLFACSNEGGQETGETSGPMSAGTDDEAAERYREKVERRVSSSVVSSFSREWGVPESKVECVLADLDVTQLDDAATDTAVAAVFEGCGVDPSLVR